MSPQHLVSHGLVALAAAGAGWWLAQAPSGPTDPATAAASVVVLPKPSHPPSMVEVPRPLIAVAHDGNVTLRVEQQPLQWVLEQIEAQAGPLGDPACTGSGSRSAPTRADATRPKGENSAARATTTGPARPSPAGRSASTPEPTDDALLQSLESGTEAERYAALRRANERGLDVPAEVLKQQFASDASERLGLLAFDTWLEPLADSPSGLHAALTEALYVNNASVRAEAARRLDALPLPASTSSVPRLMVESAHDPGAVAR